MIGEDSRLLHGAPPLLTNGCFHYTLGLWPVSAIREPVGIVLSPCTCTASLWRSIGGWSLRREILEDLRTIFSAVCQDFEATMQEFDGERDPVHLLITYPPKVAISRLVNSLKGVSSRLIRKKHCPPPSSEHCGVVVFGLRVILRARQEVPHSPSFDNILSNKRLRSNRFVVAPYIPALNDGVLRRILINFS